MQYHVSNEEEANDAFFDGLLAIMLIDSQKKHH